MSIYAAHQQSARDTLRAWKNAAREDLAKQSTKTGMTYKALIVRAIARAAALATIAGTITGASWAGIILLASLQLPA